MFASESQQYVSQFGREIAIVAGDSRFDSVILEYSKQVVEESQPHFLSGYLWGVHGIDLTRWDVLVAELLESALPRRWIVRAVVSSGTSEKMFDRILELYEVGAIGAFCFNWLGYGLSQGDADNTHIVRALDAMLVRRDDGYFEMSVALAARSLCDPSMRNASHESTAFELLTAEEAFAEEAGTMTLYYWHQLAERFRTQFPERDLELLSRIIGREAPLYILANGGYPGDIAQKICAAHPADAWKIVGDVLLGDKYYNIKYWLADGGSMAMPTAPAILAFSHEEIFKWVDVNPALRAPLMTEMLPPTIENAPSGDLTREFLEKYGALEQVGDLMIARFFTGSYTGKPSQMHATKRENARRWMRETSSPTLQTWLWSYIETLNERVEHDLIMEERGFF